MRRAVVINCGFLRFPVDKDAVKNVVKRGKWQKNSEKLNSTHLLGTVVNLIIILQAAFALKLFAKNYKAKLLLDKSCAKDFCTKRRA